MKTCNFFAILCVVFFLYSCKKEKTVPVPSAENNIIVETKPATLIANKQRVDSIIGGYYSGLPALYDITTKNYPLIVFIHGA